MISGNLNTAATQSGVGGISGGGGSGHHNVYVIGNGELPPIPPAVFTPPIEDINPMETAQNKLLTSLGLDELSDAGQWVNNNDNFLEVLEINKFLKQHTENEVTDQEAKDFAEELIKALDNDDYTDLLNLPVFNQPDPYDVWNEITQEERELTKSFPMQSYQIYKNRPIATNATIQEFGFNRRNDKSDAFRHAFYNALNTYSVGSYYAELFSDAHESEVPSNLNLEKQMDLFNNSVGHNANINYPNQSKDDLIDKIMLELTDGNLRYLSPLDAVVAPNYGINADTQLTPTNQ